MRNVSGDAQQDVASHIDHTTYKFFHHVLGKLLIDRSRSKEFGETVLKITWREGVPDQVEIVSDTVTLRRRNFES